MPAKNWKSVAIRDSDLQILQFLSKISGLSMSQILHDIFYNLGSIASTFKSLNFQFEADALADTLTITLFGRSSFTHGAFDSQGMTDEEVDAKIKRESGKLLKENGEKKE